MKTGMAFVVFIIVFYAVGFGLLGYGLWAAKRSVEAAEWPTTRGALERITFKGNSDSDGATHQVLVEYTYTVAGKPYRGSRLAFGYGASAGKKAHEEIEQKLKNAKSVDVRYDPFDPSSSVLSFGFHRTIQIALAFAITWLAFVSGFALLWWLTLHGDSVLLQNLSVQ